MFIQYQGFDKRSSKEKKTSRVILRHGESKSFIPRSREPSSIEKILGEADQLLIKPPTSPARLWKPASPRAASPEAASPRFSSARLTLPPRYVSPTVVRPTTRSLAQNGRGIRHVKRPEPTDRKSVV